MNKIRSLHVSEMCSDILWVNDSKISGLAGELSPLDIVRKSNKCMYSANSNNQLHGGLGIMLNCVIFCFIYNYDIPLYALKLRTHF